MKDPIYGFNLLLHKIIITLQTNRAIMARQIIKQPNGLYCIFSSICDNVTHYNHTKESIIEMYVQESRIEITERINGIVDQLEKGEKPYYQFTQTFDEMINWVEEFHGKDEANKLKKTIIK